MRQLFLLLVTATCAFSCVCPSAGAGDAEIIRDTWGIPHVFSETDAGAFRGLGYATAEDRALQMTYCLRIIQGRLSEMIGETAMRNRDDTSINHDRRMRTFGFYRAAQRTAAGLDAESSALLQAYCDGVNAYFLENADHLHPLFTKLELTHEPWTPADCLASWWHLAQFFAPDGTRDLMVSRNKKAGRGGEDRRAPEGLQPLPPDDAAAVVKRADVPEAWIQRLQEYAREHGSGAPPGESEGAKFSHAWVVGGKRTTTGAAVLVSDPQTPVRNPSLLYEFHLQGATFNVRGVGVAGSPVILIGFSRDVAWGATALGADQADLFKLDTDAEHADQYRFDGEWRPMTVLREQIRIKGHDPIEYTVRETHLGPVATAFSYARPQEGEVALKRIPVSSAGGETITAALAMMRAANVAEFDAALGGWQFPSANMIFGDRHGGIGYHAVGAMPLRSRLDPSGGREAAPGHTSAQDWQGMLPHELLPHVLNPSAGFLHSGNHRPIESWYPLRFGNMTGAGGDTTRSWRLRELLTAKAQYTPEEVLQMHHDATNPARRDIVRLGLHLRDTLQRPLTQEALEALNYLEPWYRNGASSALGSPGAEVASELGTFFRFAATDLAYVYGGGEGGLSYFLKTAATRLAQDPKADLLPLEQEFIERSLATAWLAAREKYGEDKSTWNQQARDAVKQGRLGFLETLDGFPEVEPGLSLPVPALHVTDGGTIASQLSQSYTQWVPLHDPDQALSVMPIGQSERADVASRLATVELWSQGRLHAAPLSRAAVEPLAVSRRQLNFP